MTSIVVTAGRMAVMTGCMWTRQKKMNGQATAHTAPTATGCPLPVWAAIDHSKRPTAAPAIVPKTRTR
mgnify:CR=1 FL=1